MAVESCGAAGPKTAVAEQLAAAVVASSCMAVVVAEGIDEPAGPLLAAPYLPQVALF